MLHPFQIVEQNFTGNAYYKMKKFEALYLKNYWAVLKNILGG